MLLGHMEEVTSVAWCPSDFSKVCFYILNILSFGKLKLINETENIISQLPLLSKHRELLPPPIAFSSWFQVTFSLAKSPCRSSWPIQSAPACTVHEV